MERTNGTMYSIGVVAGRLNVSVETIRLYEREGLIIPQKTKAGHRRFSEHDIDRLECIREMLTKKGMNLEGVRRVMAMIPCWRIHPECSAEDYADCPALNNSALPCWVLEGKPALCAEADCYTCPVYQLHVDCDGIKSLYHTQTFTKTIPPSIKGG